MTWDLSVKALAPFPQVLAMMAEQTEWTLKWVKLSRPRNPMLWLGSETALESVRCGQSENDRRAEGGCQRRDVRDRACQSEVVYVPRYDPAVVYGSWGYPAYPLRILPGLAGSGRWSWSFGFWGAVAVGPVWGWGWGSWNWGGG